MNKDIKQLVESFTIDSSIFDIDDESYLIQDDYIYYPKTKKSIFLQFLLFTDLYAFFRIITILI